MEKLRIKNLLESKTPFAVMQYFVSLKARKDETSKVYELMYLDLEEQIVRYKKLNEDSITFLKNNLDLIKIVIDNKDGKIYEFNNFKQYKELNNIEH